MKWSQPNALLAPTQLTATSKSSAEIDLSWRDTNSQESGYLIGPERLYLSDGHDTST